MSQNHNNRSTRQFKRARREFLKRALIGAPGISTALATGLNLSLVNSVLAQEKSQFNDYRALVCLFLYGGNDSLNMLVPTENSHYRRYANVRQNLAYSQASLSPLRVRGASPRYAVGMPSAMSQVSQLFHQQRLSIVSNVGTLLQPITRQDVDQRPQLLPPQLYSHNDQQHLWQNATDSTLTTTGWAGRMADQLSDGDGLLPMNISVDGNNLWQTSAHSNIFTINSQGVEKMQGLDPRDDYSQRRHQLFQRLLKTASNPFERQYQSLQTRAMKNNLLVADVLENNGSNSDYPEAAGDVGQQLKMVARLASAQQRLKQQRQIFFIGMGGWDTHDAQSDSHPYLLGMLSAALAAFNDDLDARGLSENITAFTMSDFGRTLTSNGDGTDHGWGGHQLVMGGAVRGGRIIGRLPELELGSPDDVGGGRIIPQISVEQYTAPLARWFGLDETGLNAVLPNLERFDRNAVSLFS